MVQNIGVMTTTWAAVRSAAVPAIVLGATTAYFLTNDTTSSESARQAAGTVADWPSWAGHLVEGVSEGGLVLLALLLAAAWWRARSREPRRVATAVLGGVGVVLALAVSELLKLLLTQDRPCRSVPGLEAVVSCPPIGDWSLPSNHPTLAAARAAASIWTAPRWWPLASLLAGAVAAARVGLGVHYPHDVVDGLVIGALVVSLLVVLPRRPATRLVVAAGGTPLLGWILTAEQRRLGEVGAGMLSAGDLSSEHIAPGRQPAGRNLTATEWGTHPADPGRPRSTCDGPGPPS